eukprot:11197243-Lingulodinium_polyedra.AAC.1
MGRVHDEVQPPLHPAGLEENTPVGPVPIWSAHAQHARHGPSRQRCTGSSCPGCNAAKRAPL